MGGDLVLDVAPTKLAFVQNEPITLNVVLSNRSSRVVKVLFQYPHDLGLTFSCERTESSGPGARSAGRARAALPILPKKALRFAVVLDRYLRINAPGRYVLGYRAVYTDHDRDGGWRDFNFHGECRLQIVAGDMTPEAISSIAKGLKSKSQQERLEAIEQLLWIKRPEVIDPLRDAAKAEINYLADIVQALGRQLPSADARKALIDVVLGGDDRSLREFFRLSQEGRVVICDEEYRGLLSSRNADVRLKAFQHLVATGDRDKMALVLPLTNDVNPIIRKMVVEAVNGTGTNGTGTANLGSE